VLEALREAGLGEMDYKVISRPFMEHE